MPFKDVDTKLAFPVLEQSIEQWWKDRGIIKQALESGDQAHPFIFFEGPPTANGRPGVHHVEARVTKDLIVRYQRMRGRYVIGARGGWDTHGLPVEVEVEKELGFKGKPDIEKYGIKEFNAKCKESVNRYVDEFERLTDRIAFWLDLDNPYKTYDNSYIESLWWILRQLWDQDLLFRDYKVTMHCPRCGTTLLTMVKLEGRVDRHVELHITEVELVATIEPRKHPLARELDPADVAIVVVVHLRRYLADLRRRVADRPHEQSRLTIEIQAHKRAARAVSPGRVDPRRRDRVARRR